MSKRRGGDEGLSATKGRASKRALSAVAVESQAVYPSVPAHELNRLLVLKHPNPHSVLGIHLRPDGVIVRAYRPDAERVLLQVGRERPREMIKSHPAGFFELLLTDRREIFPYRLKVSYPGGRHFTQRDAYTYLPTFTDLDEHLFNEGRHERIYEKLGAHPRKIGSVSGVSFAVWAPAAAGASVVGNFNNWDGRLHQMRRLGTSGVWELFIPDLGPGELYKYELRPATGLPFLKSDPYAFYTERPPATSAIVYRSKYRFRDGAWMERRAEADQQRLPLSIYELHQGSWRQVTEEGNRSLTYRELAPVLARYVREMGFTHVEFMPLKEHPYGGSWGYQVGNYYAPSARYGTPDDLRFLIDYLHRHEIGVIMDWVPAHFPKDAFALGRFDGTALYEHLDPRLGEHPDWGTYIFNYGRNEVRNFLIANALFWAEEFHIDGLRVDAVASMLYLDYSRKEGQWIPNRYGGRENLEAIAFLKELNTVVHAHHPGFMMVAEESTAWPMVTRPVADGGLGFDFKWNMGWMHDTLQYFSKDPIHRQFNHNLLTFGLVYAWSEHFILPFSHDEVVHGKHSLLDKMPGEGWQKFATLRALYAYMWAHPGKKLIFMGGEFGQWREWSEKQSLDWHLLEQPPHEGLQRMLRDINHHYRREGALWEADGEPAGFEWIEAGDAQGNTLSFMRVAPTTGRRIVCICNFAPVVRDEYRTGLPAAGAYRVVLNTDGEEYGGRGMGQVLAVEAEAAPRHGQAFSACLKLPALTTLWLEAPDE
ncbi:MAG TPA: 1,4-alpha-glucan branching protein GlgB [Pyrinomonadaceae bacterium]|jgi:1,4-alpha-glucan branching enzyme